VIRHNRGASPRRINSAYGDSAAQNFLLAELTGPAVDTWLQQSVTPIKEDPNSTVGFYDYHNKRYYLKVYRAKGRLDSCWHRLGWSRPFRQWRRINAFCAELQSPRPLLVVVGADSDCTYYATDFVADCRDLNSALVGEQRLPREQAAKVLADCGAMLGKMHRLGWFHGDLKWSNLLLGPDGMLSIIDLDGLRRLPRWRPRAASGRDLARFVLNAEEFLTDVALLEDFLAGYCQQTGSSRQQCIDAFYPSLLSLREKHRRKYGLRGQLLF